MKWDQTLVQKKFVGLETFYPLVELDLVNPPQASVPNENFPLDELPILSKIVHQVPEEFVPKGEVSAKGVLLPDEIADSEF